MYVGTNDKKVKFKNFLFDSNTLEHLLNVLYIFMII